MERIGRLCFCDSGIEQIQLPSTIREIRDFAFDECRNLEVIYVEDGCEASFSDAWVPGSTSVIPIFVDFAEYDNIQDLRKIKDAVVPEGIKKIGNHWFWRSGIESVIIPTSVREIGADAFHGCENLKQVTFASGSKLEKIGAGSFCTTGIERIVIPKNVIEIQKDAFYNCESLREVAFEEGSKLKKIGPENFRNSGIEKITIPKGVEDIQRKAFFSCKSLKNIWLPDKLQKIGIECFGFSGLEKIVLPVEVKEVGAYAFWCCE